MPLEEKSAEMGPSADRPSVENLSAEKLKADVPNPCSGTVPRGRIGRLLLFLMFYIIAK